MSEPRAIPALVLGGRGYVAGELLRLLAVHPDFRLAGVVSSSGTGEPVAGAFPHLAGVLPEGMRFRSRDELTHIAEPGPMALFAATPHGETAALLDAALGHLERSGFEPRAVDLSADFRFHDPARYAAIYGVPHGAPHRMEEFACAVPEHHRGPTPRHAAQPGCFTTAAVLAAHPFVSMGFAEGPVFVSAITGSSGSGRTPGANTHHPERRSALHAYAPLAHRHEAEMRLLLGRANGGVEPEVEFVPHSGPFVRGIHATVRMSLARDATADELAGAMADAYRAARFVRVAAEPSRLTDVVGTNDCRLGVAVRGRTAVITSVIDNLVKGAAGGAVQWMNRLFELPEDRGLRLAGLGIF